VKIKGEIKVVEQELQKTQSKDDDFLKFVEFSLDYVDDLNAKWWGLTPDRRERCKQLSFPGGIFVTRNKTVSTPLISAIYRYEDMKKEHRSALNSVDGEPTPPQMELFLS
jgi:hypothetical protein